MGILYHASANPNLDALEPQRTISKDKYIGDFVFATADKTLAIMYLIPKGYGSIMHSKNNPPKIQICTDEAEIDAKDKGGAIYMLDSSDFHESPQKELSEYEMVAGKTVVPISKDVFESSFDALKQFGVEVEFISQEEFNRLSHQNT